MSHNYKKLGIDSLVGKVITSYKFDKGDFDGELSGGETFGILLEDDSCGCNDSYAYFGKCDLNNLIGHVITAAEESSGSFNNDGCVLKLKAGEFEGFIEIVHEHNGYYGFSYEVYITEPKQ